MSAGCGSYLPNGAACDTVMRIGAKVRLLWRCSENDENEEKKKRYIELSTQLRVRFDPIPVTPNPASVKLDRYFPSPYWTEVMIG